MAGVRKKDPATMVTMNGNPNRANGCLASNERYREAIVFDSAEERNFFAPNTAILDGDDELVG